jgi:carboxyl-terminal processing protease
MRKFPDFAFAFLVLFFAGTATAQDELAPPPVDVTESSVSTQAGDEIPFDEIRTFAEVFAKVKNDYVETVNDRQLIEGAIRGLLEGLDPHSAYLDKDAFESLQEGTSGEFGGLGIEVSMENGFVKVIAPIDDTPAQKAGIR